MGPTEREDEQRAGKHRREHDEQPRVSVPRMRWALRPDTRVRHRKPEDR